MELSKVISVRKDAEDMIKKATVLINACKAHREDQTGQEPEKFREFRQAAEKLKNNIFRNVRRPQPKKLHVGEY